MFLIANIRIIFEIQLLCRYVYFKWRFLFASTKIDNIT